MNNNYIYILVMAVTTYLIRVLPLTLIRKPIKNQFLQSFLYYVPYVTLTVMTFPAILDVTTGVAIPIVDRTVPQNALTGAPVHAYLSAHRLRDHVQLPFPYPFSPSRAL